MKNQKWIVFYKIFSKKTHIWYNQDAKSMSSWFFVFIDSKGQLLLLTLLHLFYKYRLALFWRTSSAWLPFFVCQIRFYFLTFFCMALKLLENESILCTLKKSKVAWFAPMLWAFLFLISQGAHSSNPNGAGGLFMLIFAVAFIIDLVSTLRYNGYVTNKRVVRHSGVFLREDELHLEQVESVSVERFKYILWHRIFFRGSGWVELMFDYASNHDTFKDAVYNAKERLKQNNLNV